MGIMWSPFGLCFRPGMGPVEFFVIKLLSELGGSVSQLLLHNVSTSHRKRNCLVVYKLLTILFPSVRR